MDQQQNNSQKPSFWIGKTARLEIVKDGVRLNFHNTTILEIDDSHVTFRDVRDNKVLAFERSLVKEMVLQ